MLVYTLRRGGPAGIVMLTRGTMAQLLLKLNEEPDLAMGDAAPRQYHLMTERAARRCSSPDCIGAVFADGMPCGKCGR